MSLYYGYDHKKTTPHPFHQLTIDTSRPREMKDTVLTNDGYHTANSTMTNTSTITKEAHKTK